MYVPASSGGAKHCISEGDNLFASTTIPPKLHLRYLKFGESKYFEVKHVSRKNVEDSGVNNVYAPYEYAFEGASIPSKEHNPGRALLYRKSGKFCVDIGVMKQHLDHDNFVSIVPKLRRVGEGSACHPHAEISGHRPKVRHDTSNLRRCFVLKRNARSRKCRPSRGAPPDSRIVCHLHCDCGADRVSRRRQPWRRDAQQSRGVDEGSRDGYSGVYPE